MSKESLAKPEIPSTFDGVVGILSKVVPSYDISDGDIEYPEWHGIIRRLDLATDVARQAGLGARVRCRISGDSIAGVTIVMRAPNPFNRRRFRYLLEPVYIDENTAQGYNVMQSPGKLDQGQIFWEPLVHAAPDVAIDLIRSLQQRAES